MKPKRQGEAEESIVGVIPTSICIILEDGNWHTSFLKDAFNRARNSAAHELSAFTLTWLPSPRWTYLIILLEKALHAYLGYWNQPFAVVIGKSQEVLQDTAMQWRPGTFLIRWLEICWNYPWAMTLTRTNCAFFLRTGITASMLTMNL